MLLAHNYQLPEIQDVADHTGDSLALSRIAARSSASTIVFCGVHFMAETAKILAPDKTVLIPDAAAGCSLADSITADELRAWKAEHPGAVVVSYVNTTAAVKAETDVCCTSSNAVEVVASIPADREVLFLPDQFLGAHVRRVTGRENLHVWAGECHVHAGINGATLAAQVDAHPDAELYVHPECGCATSALYLAGAGAVPPERVRILSTGGMLDAARSSSAREVLVATEVGMLHQLRRAAPDVEFRAVNDRASCRYMKMITPEKLLRALREGRDEVHVDPELAARGRRAVQRMIEIGSREAGSERLGGGGRAGGRRHRGRGAHRRGGGGAARRAGRRRDEGRGGRRARRAGRRAGSRSSSGTCRATAWRRTSPTPSPPAAGLCDEAATAAILRDGPRRGRPAAGAGRGLRRRAAPALARTREGGHSAFRVIHAGGDATGAEIERALVRAAAGLPLLTGHVAVDVLRDRGRVVGLAVLDDAGRPGRAARAGRAAGHRRVRAALRVDDQPGHGDRRRRGARPARRAPRRPTWSSCSSTPPCSTPARRPGGGRW